MNKRHSAAFLAFSIVWSSVVPAFAQGNIQATGVAGRALPTMAATPAIPTLPASVLPAALGLPGGINAGVIESQTAHANANAAAASPAAAISAAAEARVSAANPTAASAVTAAGTAASPAAAAATPATNMAEYAAASQPTAGGIAKTIVAKIANAIANKLPWLRVFDSNAAKSADISSPAGAVAIRPLPAPTLPQGLDLGNAPQTPAPKKVGGVELNAWDTPTAKSAGGIFDAGPRILKADPASEADIERALRDMVDADAAKYGVTSAELKTVHVKRVAGRGDQADTIYAYFRQQRKSTNTDGTVQAVEVHGSQLSFTVKVVKGQPTVMAAMAKLYPSIAVKTNATISDAQAKAAAEGKLPQGAGISLELVERKIVFHDGAWKTVNLYEIDGLPQAVGIMVAVDVATGEVFAWDARMGMQAAPNADPAQTGPDAAATVNAHARAEANDHRPGDDKWTLVEQSLPHLNVTINGKSMTADADGKVSATISGNSGSFKADLSGSWAKIQDQNRKPVQISASIKPGDNTVIANPTAEDEGTINQLNTYIWATRIHDWWSQRLGSDKRIDKQIPINSNIDDECNAYYTPGRPSLNFFKSSKNCSDTGRPGVVAHEYGHFVDDMIGGITNGGMSEGWGDIGSMFLLGTPIIGEGFLKNRNPSWIRHGENTYQYNENDEVHDQGQAWMGFAWKLRKALVASLGEIEGTAQAESLIIPTLFAKASDIPAQMAQVLLNAMDKNGNVRYEKEIRAAAKAHGIDLPKNPGLVASLWNGLSNAFRGGVSVEEAGSGLLASTEGLKLVSDAGQAKKLVVKASSSRREAVLKAIESAVNYRSGEHAALSVRVVEKRGVFGTRLEIQLSGPAESVAYMTEQIKRLAQ